MILLYKECISRTIKLFLAYQNDVKKNFAIVMSVVVKRVDCSLTLATGSCPKIFRGLE